MPNIRNGKHPGAVIHQRRAAGPPHYRRLPIPQPSSGHMTPGPRRCLWRRVRRGGMRQGLWQRGNRPPLPSMIHSNMRSLKRKMDELQYNATACYEYRESHGVYWDTAASWCSWLYVQCGEFFFNPREATGKDRGGSSVFWQMVTNGADSTRCIRLFVNSMLNWSAWV